MASTEYIRLYMREYRQGKRRGWRKMVAGSRSWLKARRAALGMTRSRTLLFLELNGEVDVDPKGRDREEPMGPQVVPVYMTVCSRCDILTRRPGVCGYCAAEMVRAAAAA